MKAVKSDLKDDATIRQAKDFLNANYKAGAICPCCNQHVRLYKHKLNAKQCQALIQLYHDCKQIEYVHVNQIEVHHQIQGSFAKLEHWQLIEKKPIEAEDKKNSGMWKITEIGKKFVELKKNVPSHVLILNGTRRGYDGDRISIRIALGNQFSYNELMSSYASF